MGGSCQVREQAASSGPVLGGGGRRGGRPAGGADAEGGKPGGVPRG